MKPTQFVNVIFMQEHAPAPIDPGLLRATPENKRKLIKFVDDATPKQGTDPDPALKAAFAMEPELIYFLCDPGDFPDAKGTMELCKNLNPQRRIKIITIGFFDDDKREGEATLKQIASDSGGQYKFVSAKDLGE